MLFWNIEVCNTYFFSQYQYQYQYPVHPSIPIPIPILWGPNFSIPIPIPILQNQNFQYQYQYQYLEVLQYQYQYQYLYRCSILPPTELCRTVPSNNTKACFRVKPVELPLFSGFVWIDTCPEGLKYFLLSNFSSIFKLCKLSSFAQIWWSRGCTCIVWMWRGKWCRWNLSILGVGHIVHALLCT